jgi:farnesyl-diphosphate farnesyltransferase
VALGHYAEAERYILSIPRRCGRLRMACLWPVLIGLPTLAMLACEPDWLDPARTVMVPTAEVMRMLAISWPAIHSDAMVRGWIGSRRALLERVLRDPSVA